MSEGPTGTELKPPTSPIGPESDFSPVEKVPQSLQRLPQSLLGAQESPKTSPKNNPPR